jgi:tetratricopeptide (TPR) repeat protein
VTELRDSHRFQIRRRIGEGGMGVVYEAHDRQRETLVALKVLRHLEGGALYRFKREFRSLSTIAHPNLVSLYELFSEEELWFFSMELVAGADFYEHVRSVSRRRHVLETAEDRGSDETPTIPAEEATLPERPIGVLDVTKLRPALAQLATGLVALHDSGRLHRDLKPSNVMVTAEGRIVILDFGLVAHLGADEQFESTLQHVVGTAGYMSPEQATGGSIGPASDWYAFGTMLYEVLTGRRPFVGRPMDVLERKRAKDAPTAGDREGVPEDLARLADRLLSREPEARPSGREVLQALGVLPAVQSIRRRIPLVARDKPLAVLRDNLAAVRAGRPAAVFVAGGSGLGKTALIDAFLAELRQLEDAFILRGSCYEREAVRFEAFDDLIDDLSHVLRSLVIADVDAILPRHAASLARLFPVLEQVDSIERAVVVERSSGQKTPGAELFEVQRRAFSALRELLRSLSRRLPVILVIDDLQWGDAESAPIFQEIAGGPDAPPILLIVAFRTEDERTSRLVAMLREAVGRGSLARIDLSPLSFSEAKGLARVLLEGNVDEAVDRERLAANIAKESGGSPYFIVELAEHVDERADLSTSATLREGEGDAFGRGLRTADLSLEEILASRIDLLPEEAKRLLEVVAAAGHPLPESILIRAAGLVPPRSAEGAIPPARLRLSLGILRSENFIRTRRVEGREDQVATYHERIRRVVARGLDAHAIAAIHGAIATGLELGGDPDPELLAHHLLRSREVERARGFALLAARSARGKLSLDRAADLYEIAAARPPSSAEELPASLQLEAVEALIDAGRGEKAADLLLALEKRAGGRLEKSGLLRQAAEQLLRTGRVDRGVDVLERALALQGLSLARSSANKVTRLARARAEVAWRGLRGLRHASRTPTPEETERVDLLWSVATGLGMVDVIAALDFQSRHLSAALDAGEPARIVRALAMEACYSAARGSPNDPRTAALIERAERLAQGTGDPRSAATVLMARGAAALLGGSFAEGERASREAERLFTEHGVRAQWEIATAGIFRLLSLAMMGRIRDLVGHVRDHVPSAARREDRYALANARSGLGNLAWLAGDDPDGAVAALDETVPHLPRSGFTMPHAYELIARTNATLYRGFGGGALALIEDRRPRYARSLVMRVQFLRIELSFARARAAIAAGRRDVALEEAARLDREPVPYARALARLVRALSEHEKNREAAHRALGRAAKSLAEADLGLLAAIAQRRQGRISRSEELAAKAEKWIRGQGVVDVERFAGVFAPSCSSARR